MVEGQQRVVAGAGQVRPAVVARQVERFEAVAQLVAEQAGDPALERRSVRAGLAGRAGEGGQGRERVARVGGGEDQAGGGLGGDIGPGLGPGGGPVRLGTAGQEADRPPPLAEPPGTSAGSRQGASRKTAVRMEAAIAQRRPPA
jgi:hypothetical protein